MDLVPIKDVLDAAIEARRAFPEGQEVLRQFVETYVTDPLKERRERRRLDRVAQLADEKIGDREKEENLKEIMNSTEVEPLLAAIQEDDRKELQEIWANMLAKFATGENLGFRREYIDTLKNLEPIDIKCLEILVENFKTTKTNKHEYATKVSCQIGRTYDDVDIALDSLEKHGCFAIIAPETNTSYASYALTSYGKMLFKAASPLE